MKYVYTIAGILLVLLGTHYVAYSKGYTAGQNEVKSEIYETTSKQSMAIMQATKKALDLQRTISNNSDECFNRVWDDETIDSVNPVLRRHDDVRK